MRRLFTLLVIMLCKVAYSQCDSAEVTGLLDSLRKDSTVYKGRSIKYSRCLLEEPNSQYVYYSVTDTLNYEWERWTFYNNHFYAYNYHHGDTMEEIEYDEEGCYITSTQVEVWNDSLSTSDEGGTVYDYEKFVFYDDYGSGQKTRSETTTLIYRNGKPKQRSVHIKYWRGIPIKRKVYIYRAGYT